MKIQNKCQETVGLLIVLIISQILAIIVSLISLIFTSYPCIIKCTWFFFFLIVLEND